MTGETDLDLLIANMEPVLCPDTYVFATAAGQADLSDLDPVMTFREAEGLTLILPLVQADRDELRIAFESRMITLKVHSSLEAVGFLAEITQALKQLGIGVNPVSAFYHDHLFVPADRADEVLVTLKRLSAERRAKAGR